MIDVAAVLGGDRLALSRLLSQIEDDTAIGRQVLSELFPHTGNAHLIGVTGAPGTGKSSLVNQLVKNFRGLTGPEPPPRVAVVAVDPSSPFTGGAVLGDRIRMTELSGDRGVFIRSMASRGSLGGLARATAGLVQAFDAAGFSIILIETVGAGQAEVDIARLAHTTLVIDAPGLGDDVQAIKAGILEIADILVINKADRPGVEATERALRTMLQLAHPVPRIFQDSAGRMDGSQKNPDVSEDHFWIPSIHRTIATRGEGIAELVEAIFTHRSFLKKSGDYERRERARLENELYLRVQAVLIDRWRGELPEGLYDALLTRVIDREISPEEAVANLVSSPVDRERGQGSAASGGIGALTT